MIVKVVSGLGNQLFQYAVARQLSIKLNTPLKIDTSFFSAQNLRTYKLDVFNIHATVATPQEVASLTNPYYDMSLLGRIRRKINHVVDRKSGYFKENILWVFDPRLETRKADSYIDGYWQNHRYFIQLHPLIKEELTLKPLFFKNIIQKAQEIGSVQSVSVHIRRGDYITDKSAASLMGILPLSYYQQSIEFIKSKVTNPVFYFFSDDPEWVKNDSGLLQPGSQVIQGYADFEDLSLMNQCKHNIIANSSFSWWGAFLNKNPDKIVVAPKQWVIQEIINDRIEIQLPSWIKM